MESVVTATGSTEDMNITVSSYDVTENAGFVFGKTVQSDDPTVYLEYKISRWMTLLYRPVISTFGMTGNALSIVVFLTTSLRHSPTAVYMVTLAALDFVICFYAGLQLFLLVFVGEEKFFTESWHCRSFYFTLLFTIHFDTLTMVSMTAQRYLAVRFPLHAARWSTKKAAVVNLIVVGTISFLANVVHVLTFRLNEDWDGSYRGRCSVGTGFGQYIQIKVYPWIDSVLYFLLPTTSITTLNVLIFLALRKANEFKRSAAGSKNTDALENGCQGQQGQTTECSTETPDAVTDVVDVNGADADLGPAYIPSKDDVNGYNRTSDVEKNSPDTTTPASDRTEARAASRANSSSQLTRMLLTVTVAFLVFTLPAGVFVILFRQWNPPTGYQKAQFNLVRDIAGALMYSNHAANFWLYCLAGARFRAKAASIFCFFCRRREGRVGGFKA